jgi:transcriptional regulator with XRE-family HTH domain
MPHIRGDRVTRLRETRGLRQYELAIFAKLSQGHVSRIEHGDVDSVGSSILEQLARELETNVDYLIGTSDDPRPNHYINKSELTPDEQAIIEDYRKIKVDYIRDSVHSMLKTMLAADVKARPDVAGGGSPPPKSQSPAK